MTAEEHVYNPDNKRLPFWDGTDPTAWAALWLRLNEEIAERDLVSIIAKYPEGFTKADGSKLKTQKHDAWLFEKAAETESLTDDEKKDFIKLNKARNFIIKCLSDPIVALIEPVRHSPKKILLYLHNKYQDLGDFEAISTIRQLFSIRPTENTYSAVRTAVDKFFAVASKLDAIELDRDSIRKLSLILVLEGAEIMKDAVKHLLREKKAAEGSSGTKKTWLEWVTFINTELLNMENSMILSTGQDTALSAGFTGKGKAKKINEGKKIPKDKACTYCPKFVRAHLRVQCYYDPNSPNFDAEKAKRLREKKKKQLESALKSVTDSEVDSGTVDVKATVNEEVDKVDDEVVLLTSEVAALALTPHSGFAIFDCGASRHMFPSDYRSAFTETGFASAQIGTASADTLRAVMRGNVHLVLNGHKVVLKGALLVQGLRTPLISLQRLENVTSTITPNHLTIKSSATKGGKASTFYSNDSSNGLFWVTASPNATGHSANAVNGTTSKSAMSTEASFLAALPSELALVSHQASAGNRGTSFVTWHNRLHMGRDTIMMLPMAGQHVVHTRNLHSCDSCAAANMRKRARKSRWTAPKRLGELVTGDVKGPILVPPLGPADPNSKVHVCFLIMVELLSGHICLVPLNSKADAGSAVLRYGMWLSDRGIQMERFHTDNAKELTKIESQLKARGCVLTTREAYVPVENPHAERAVGLAVTGILTRLMQSGLPAMFWREAALHWVECKNNVPRANGHSANRTIGEHTTLHNIRAFGCRAYILSTTHRWSIRQRLGIHLRHVGSGAYRISREFDQKVVETSECLFDEQSFPMAGDRTEHEWLSRLDNDETDEIDDIDNINEDVMDIDQPMDPDVDMPDAPDHDENTEPENIPAPSVKAAKRSPHRPDDRGGPISREGWEKLVHPDHLSVTNDARHSLTNTNFQPRRYRTDLPDVTGSTQFQYLIKRPTHENGGPRKHERTSDAGPKYLDPVQVLEAKGGPSRQYRRFNPDRIYYGIESRRYRENAPSPATPAPQPATTSGALTRAARTPAPALLTPPVVLSQPPLAQPPALLSPIVDKNHAPHTSRLHTQKPEPIVTQNLLTPPVVASDGSTPRPTISPHEPDDMSPASLGSDSSAQIQASHRQLDTMETLQAPETKGGKRWRFNPERIYYSDKSRKYREEAPSPMTPRHARPETPAAATPSSIISPPIVLSDGLTPIEPPQPDTPLTPHVPDDTRDTDRRWDPNDGLDVGELPDHLSSWVKDAAVAYALAAGDRGGVGPFTLGQVKNMADWPEFKQALKEEINSIEANNVWQTVEAPKHRPVTLKVLFTRKLGIGGQLLRHKARIVVRGFEVPKRDGELNAAPTGSVHSLRLVLSLIAEERMFLIKADVKTAFLRGKSENTVVVALPAEIAQEAGYASRFLRVTGNLYGLRSAPLTWYTHLKNILIALSFSATCADPCVFIRASSGLSSSNMAIVYIYVDDLLIASHSRAAAEDVLREIREHLVVEVDPSPKYLGAHIERRDDFFLINLTAYITGLCKKSFVSKVSDTGDTIIQPVRTPTCTVPDRPEMRERACQKEYRSLLGGALFVAMTGRPDIAFACTQLALQGSNPTQGARHQLGHLLRYLWGTRNLSLSLSLRFDDDIECFTDASWAETSVAGVMIGSRRTNTWFYYSSAGIAVTCLSSAESELVAGTKGGQQLLGVLFLGRELGMTLRLPLPVFVDNQAVVFLSKAAGTGRRKVVQLKARWIREMSDAGILGFSYVPTGTQLADGLTKGLSAPKIKAWLPLLGLSEASGERASSPSLNLPAAETAEE